MRLKECKDFSVQLGNGFLTNISQAKVLFLLLDGGYKKGQKEIEKPRQDKF